MNLENVFYFKNIVDEQYPDEDCEAVDIQSITNDVKDKIQVLPVNDFITVMISCFIPDLYSKNGKREKLFTKLTELMVGEWWRRLGGDYKLPTKKSGTQDVELLFNNSSIVCDAKVFRLGRSQKAPNVKDFLKLASVKLWIDNLNTYYENNHSSRRVIGGLVTYSSLHEWEGNSEVYEECTNHDTPVVMLPYEVMALLLKYKDHFELSDLSKLWKYSENNVTTSRSKSNYWQYISEFICEILSITQEQYLLEMKQFHKEILLACTEYRKIVENNISTAKEKISQEFAPYTSYAHLKEYAINQILWRDNATALDYLKHINDFRHYSDQDDN